MNAAERASNAAVAVTANPSRREMVVATPEPNSGPASAQTAGAAQNQLASKTYTFDGVFGPDATQAEVYESAIEPIVLETLEGFNCTVFAYGQTGTGKTHTMEGDDSSSESKSVISSLYSSRNVHFTEYSVVVFARWLKI